MSAGEEYMPSPRSPRMLETAELLGEYDMTVDNLMNADRPHDAIVSPEDSELSVEGEADAS